MQKLNKDVKIQIRIDKVLDDKLDRVIVLKRRCKSDLIRIIIEDYVNNVLNVQ